MGKLTIHETPMNGLYVVETEPFVDHRGAFARWFCEEELAGVIGERRIKNVNFSRTAKAGSIRRFHSRHALPASAACGDEDGPVYKRKSL